MLPHATRKAPVTDSAPPKRADLKVCGDCSLCCKVYDIPELEKKMGHVCHHVRPEGGCGVWGLHPQTCQDFKCLWIRHDDMNALWRPDVCGFVLRLEPNGTTLAVDVDPDRPDAWRTQHYYDQLKLWSEVMPKNEGLVLVYVPGGLFVITPMEDLFLKAPKRGDILETGMEMTLFGLRPFARVIPAREVRKDRSGLVRRRG
ncbi:hypothetical protein [Asticcacaulis sp. EMRT-3]|uniref:hypothetical protein n=1 Tax=Asticcacaulis sp. EMRT-3 TaxID=3040349 RepID=UPI0024AEBEF0|nr:hypothetical protein [Asticcacaulis sp. EMRT-3]MDI7774080.1 hypothetical protein [Asticcacaulis sp. EMRT-3]